MTVCFYAKNRQVVVLLRQRQVGKVWLRRGPKAAPTWRAAPASVWRTGAGDGRRTRVARRCKLRAAAVQAVLAVATHCIAEKLHVNFADEHASSVTGPERHGLPILSWVKRNLHAFDLELPQVLA